MQNRHSFLCLLIVLVSQQIFAQTTYLPLWAKEGWLLDRLEIKAQKDNNLNLSTVKPYMRKAYVAVADSFSGLLLQDQNPANLTKVDHYNLNRLQANCSEYSAFATDTLPALWKNKRPVGPFFPSKGNAVELRNPGFYLSINPAVSLQQGIESDNDEPVFFRSLGVTGRGLIGKKIGFQFLATANSEAGPQPFREFVNRTNAVPGANKYEIKGDDTSHYNYADLRGSVTWNVTKYINMQFGRDQQFIGSGYRSLFLSNFAGPQTFLKFNTRIWKLNYTNLYMELSPTPDKELNKQFEKKYASMHHISVNVTKWLTMGAFESIVFGRKDHYDFSYLLPVIFLRSIEQQNGSPDNANLGFDIKANVLKKVQVYAQLMLDEFKKDEALSTGDYWWGNKQGYQVGAKYVDALGVKNLDLQAEYNQVRPFMYQYKDTVGAYTHALQPLAHPIGGNLREAIGIIRYQPMNRLYIFARLNFWKQGLDSAGINFGSDPNIDYETRPRENYFPMLAGMPATGFNSALQVSYELGENMFVEGGFMFRNYEETNKPVLNTTQFSLGFRWNMFRRDYDY